MLSPVVTDDMLPWPADALYFMTPWEEARPPGLETARSPEASSFALEAYPRYRFLREAVEEGESILWNSTEGTGAPFLANWRSRCLSPFTIPIYFLPLAEALRWSLLAKLIVAGICAYFAARRFGLARCISLSVGLAYQLAPASVLWSHAPVADVLPWLPLLMIHGDDLVRRKGLFFMGPLAFGLMLIGGAPEAALLALACCAIFVALSTWLDTDRPENGANVFSVLMISALLGAGLSAAQILPSAELFVHQVHGGVAIETSSSFSAIAALFFPGIGADDSGGQYHSLLFHVGVMQAWLLALWISVRTHVPHALRVRCESLFVASIVVSAAVIIINHVVPASSLPVVIGLEHAAFLNVFAWAIMAGAAVQGWVLLDPSECKTSLKHLLVAVPALMIMAVALALSFALSENLDSYLPFYTSAAFLAAMLVLIAWTLLRPSIRTFGYTLCALTVLNLVLVSRPLIAFSEDDAFYPETPFIRSLADHDGDLRGARFVADWPLNGNGVAMVGSTHPGQLKRYHAWTQLAETNPLLWRLSGRAGLVLGKEDLDSSIMDVRPRLRTTEVLSSAAILFEDLDTLPRARMAYEARAVTRFNADDVTMAGPPLVEQPDPIDAVDGYSALAAITAQDDNGRITVEVAETRPGILILADSYYPGWKALVDGEKARVFPVDGLFRGVTLGEGTHEVVFYFDPLSVKTGMALSLIVLLGLILFEGRKAINYLRRESRE
jgi:hypothetical protein